MYMHVQRIFCRVDVDGHHLPEAIVVLDLGVAEQHDRLAAADEHLLVQDLLQRRVQRLATLLHNHHVQLQLQPGSTL